MALLSGKQVKTWQVKNRHKDLVVHMNPIREVEKEFKIEIVEMFEIEKLKDILKILEKRNINV